MIKRRTLRPGEIPRAPASAAQLGPCGVRAPHIIGGMFGLEGPGQAPDTQPPPFLRGGGILLANGRSAVRTAVELVSARRVWVPSYLCDSLLAAVGLRGVEVRYYPVGRDLLIANDDWLAQLAHGDAVVLIDYFGLPVAESWAEAVHDRGACVIEDAAQALLSSGVGAAADFTVYSPRKFVGVPDGGILVVNADRADAQPALEAPPEAWWSRALAAAEMRARFDRLGGDRDWFEIYRQVEAEAPIGPFRMSDLSRSLLLHSFDYTGIADRRIANYRILSSLLGELAIFPELPAGAVPLGFPVRVVNRTEVQRALFRNDVYPPVHWHLPRDVPRQYTESHRLAGEIMTLPCDQRYDATDMQRMAALVRAMPRR